MGKTAKVKIPKPDKAASKQAGAVSVTKPTKAPKAVKSSRSGPWADPVKPAPLLVPAYVRERKAAAATTRTSLWVSLVVAALIAVVSGWSWWDLSTANKDLAQQKSVEATAQGRVAALQPVADYYDGLVARQESVFTQLRGELDYGRLLSSLMDQAPAGVRIESLSLANSQPCPGPDPFAAPPSYGCLSFTVTSESSGQVVRFVEDLNSGKLRPEGLWHSAFTVSSLAGAPEGGGAATYAITVNYTEQALSLTHVPLGRHEEVMAEARAKSSSPSSTGTAVNGAGAVPTPAPGGTP